MHCPWPLMAAFEDPSPGWPARSGGRLPHLPTRNPPALPGNILGEVRAT
jgi:hypothetical protein